MNDRIEFTFSVHHSGSSAAYCRAPRLQRGNDVLAAGAQVLLTFSRRHDTTHLGEPFSYASLAVSIGAGWLVLGAEPDGVGACRHVRHRRGRCGDGAQKVNAA